MEIITPIRDLKLSREGGNRIFNRTKDFQVITPNQYILSIKDFGNFGWRKKTLTSHSNLPEEAYPSQLKSKILKN